MASQTALTLATRVYNPAGTQGGVSTWRYPEDVVFNGTSTATESVKGPSRDGLYRIDFKIDTPRVASVASACACPGTQLDHAQTKLETIFPASWTKSMRQEHWDRVQSLVASAVATAAHDDLEGSW